jgi:cytochrome c oxidase subunit 4
MAGHVTSPRASTVVFLLLLVLLVVTVLAAGIEHSALAILVALAIAITKAALIVVYFMNVRFSDTVTRMASVAGFVGLAILLVLLMADYLTRPTDWRDRETRGTTPQTTLETGEESSRSAWHARNSSGDRRRNLVE